MTSAVSGGVPGPPHARRPGQGSVRGARPAAAASFVCRGVCDV